MKNKSLRFRLILILSIAALCLWTVSTTIAWFQVRKEVNEVFDAQQILFAKRLATSDLRTILINHHRTKMYYGRYQRLPKRVDNDALAFAVFTPHGQLLLSDGENGENFIYAPVKGFSHALLANGNDDMWRIFWLPAADGRLMIAVGQEVEYRDQLINQMVFSQMWIWIAGLPFLLLLIILIVNKELSGLKAVSRELNLRLPDERTPLHTENIPSEILPLVKSLNQFFDRTSSILLRERRFTSDAAHELRSPLAALRIQTEVAQIAGDDVAMREAALQNLMQGIDRANQLVEQLLTLSRLDSLVELDNLENIYWHQLIQSLVGELYFSGQKRNIELYFEHYETPPVFRGQSLLLSLMLRNIVDNAIRYCREHSTVHIQLYADRILIEDNGGGVSEEDLEKLGQRFYRPAGQNEKGSGLGLSIVYRIAELHHLKVRLENSKNFNDEILGLKISILLA